MPNMTVSCIRIVSWLHVLWLHLGADIYFYCNVPARIGCVVAIAVLPIVLRAMLRSNNNLPGSCMMCCVIVIPGLV